jgi:hypothetical protein
VELPPIAAILSEHRLQRLRCPDCGRITRAELPPEVSTDAFGPRLSAAVATLAVRNRVSRRDTTELLRELFGARISAGSVEAILQRAALALDEPCEDLLGHVRAAVFRIAEGRRRREAQALLGEGFSGVARSDRWWAYDYLDPEQRQLCWAHLVRDLTARREGLGAQKRFVAAGLEISRRLFAAWGECREDGDRARLRERLAPLQEELRALLEEAATKAARNRRHRAFAKNLPKRWPALWTFASAPGVEPANNHAERGLRGAVIYSKLSLGSQSEEGEVAIARLLSASVACRLQGRSLFAYLSDVLAAKIRGDPVPLLT